MFGSDSVYCFVGDMHVKARAKEQDTNQYIQIDFDFPLTRDLADAIFPPMAKHLYKKEGGEWVPDKNLGNTNVIIPLGAQRVEFRDNPELKIEAVIPSASIKKTWAKKTDGGDWEMAFTISFPLGNMEAAIVLMKRVKSGIYVAMAEEQPSLDGIDADETESPDADTASA